MLRVLVFFLCLNVWSQGSLTESCLFDFAQGIKAQTLIGQEDQYTSLQQPLERAQRLHSRKAVAIKNYLRKAQNSIVDFSTKEKELLNQASAELAETFKAYKLDFPKKIYYLKTNGKEEGAPYTRKNFIVFPDSSLKKNLAELKELLAHELFHILSRYHPDLSTELYKIIGFHYCGTIKESPELKAIRITNPDAPLYQHYIMLKDKKGKTFPAIPFLHLKIKSLKEVDDHSVFRHMQLSFVKIDLKKLSTLGPIIPVEAIAPSLFKQIGDNTHYIIHPEETISDNFAQIMCGIPAKTPRIHHEIKSTLR
ncbi:hypothetical protein PQO03_20415 [Lentisphaera profundi]|uniref:DUF4157 domain-containing protein n=1 Tax=Lentisphaera profundi TaxID=1658616 RepID=A0ABY7VZP1_9BACT|nr:hypothetical protein [Lentisphaera profundi]WDE98184.1 hypothetical protein PQO03_20415 [Lentisphaera profundi]